ncbi:hypothetical protein DAPPUDRAFT_113582 [Daphnia pulex]|uniref:Uncharacterized protein n=1 Tax=Daphnia pulex TaxID=6669 RepID=E9HFE8_DAPPU|nr:hypothetical protein DAPPUDRAFT_113582 [Daphnia pulex]|eukprot:EFX69548.1 hypothetical protein DAPPUDRAFT_113582 [Daphnia pulex]
MASSNKHGYVRVSEPSEFSKCLHIRSSLNSLSSFSGRPIQRFDSWLDTFERIVNNSGFSDEEMVLELYKKMTDRAQKVTKYVLESGADEYTTVKARLIDHFHGDETVEKYLKKFEKANEKLQMKVKYKAFKTFDELVSEARKYSIRLETIEGSKGIQEFVNVINKPSDSKLRGSLEMVELKQLVENQNESVNALVAALKGESNQ